MKLWELPASDGQISGENATLRQLVLNEMRGASPLLDFVEFYTFLGNSDTPLRGIDPMDAGEMRAVNSDYTSVTTTPTYDSIALKIMGDKIQTDIAYERRSGPEELAKERTRQLRVFAQSLARYFVDQTINGDGTGNNITGLKTLVPANNLIVFDPTGDGTVPLGNTTTEKKQVQKFLEALDDLTQRVVSGPSCLIMNHKTMTRLRAIAREYVTYATSENVLGEKITNWSYNGVPIVDAGYKANRGGLVIGNDEVYNSRTGCTSVYAVRFGEKANVSAATNVGIVVKDLGLVGVHYTTLVDFDVNYIILDSVSLFHLQGIVI